MTTAARDARPLLGGLAPQEFLRRYWHERPLLVRGALPDFRDPLTRDELAGLACERDVESRLVLERGGARPWQVIHGPQDARRLRRLPRTHWALLVQAADRHVPALGDLLERFTFVPRWRLDDVMASFAPRQGGVGAHLDSYDVFLLQGAGRRRWQIDTRAAQDYRPGLDLHVLKRFTPEREWVLERGDLLYLPPGVAHRGVSLDDAFTYSIGFRAPSHAELLAAYLQRVLAAVGPEARYRDPGLRLQGEPGEITRAALSHLRGAVDGALGAFRRRQRAFDRALGELLTEPRDPAPGPRLRRLSAARVRRRLAAGATLIRDPGSRVAFIRYPGGGADLFVDGRTIALPPGLAFAAPLLSGARAIRSDRLAPRAVRPGVAQLVADLVNRGAFDLVRP